jgi:hypothetical protein
MDIALYVSLSLTSIEHACFCLADSKYSVGGLLPYLTRPPDQELNHKCIK